MIISRRAARSTISILALASILLSCSPSKNEPEAPAASISPRAGKYTESELEEAWQRGNSDYAAMLGLTDPPPVERVRWVRAEEKGELTKQCMAEQGFEVDLQSDGAIIFYPVPDSQLEVRETARYICEAKYPMNPEEFRYLDPANAGELYDYYTSELVPCLEQNGHVVDSTPTRETYLANFGTPRDWTPYESVDAKKMGQKEWLSLNAACPQSPPIEY